jgi:hypothetical protein
MFRNEKIVVLDIVDRCLKLEDDRGQIISLIFIKDGKLIIKGELKVSDSSIEAPEINYLDKK